VLSKVLSIIDYGLGNIQAFLNIYNQLDIPIQVVSSHEELKKSTKLILPGVGSFDHAMNCLHRLDLVKALNYHLFERKIPILGVCVGMQIMAKMSEEGLSDGLNWVPSKVLRFSKKSINDQIKNNFPLPHMGWNKLKIIGNDPLFKNIDNPSFYFLHSYYFQPNERDIITSECSYINLFASSFSYKNFYGVQFHPEKSHKNGIELLRNFAEF